MTPTFHDTPIGYNSLEIGYKVNILMAFSIHIPMIKIMGATTINIFFRISPKLVGDKP